jgi:hypothetical protein
MEQKNLAIWKLSHGDQPFTSDERNCFWMASWRSTPRMAKQGKKFVEAPVGTLFSCATATPQRIGSSRGSLAKR